LLFGKINYTNLATFHIFVKQYKISSRFKQSMNYHQSHPANINKKFKTRRVDAAFISSAESFRGNFKTYHVGIVANKKVKSVIIKKGENKKDLESASSNLLATILGVKGEVIIGDKALKAYLKNPKEYEDLCSLWYRKYKLPFVFARFCVNKKHKFYEKLIKKFVNTKVKIPQYLLKQYSKKLGISSHDIEDYLDLISFRIDYYGKKGLGKFKKEINKK